MKPTPVSGETVIATTSQSARLSMADFMSPHRLIVTSAGRTIFVHGTTSAEYKSASAFCKALFNRDGKTNEWAGPRHLFVMRDGNWVSLNGVLARTAH